MSSTSIYTPFTYIIKFKPTSQVYYGVRYAKESHPNDLWNIYFTSSDTVNELIKEHGLESFEYQVRKTFKTKKEALTWERRILVKFDAANNPKFLNKSNGGIPSDISKEMEELRRKNISNSTTGVNKSTTHKENISKGKTGKKHSPEHIMNNGARKDWKAISPDGEIYVISHLKTFCKEQELSYRGARRSITNKQPPKKGKSKGWLFIEI